MAEELKITNIGYKQINCSISYKDKELSKNYLFSLVISYIVRNHKAS
jgi:hypothetical protein